MRSLIVAALAVALGVSTALAADTDAALAPGKPAGIKQAELGSRGFLALTAVAIVAGGIALVVTQGRGNQPVATSTTAP